MSNNICVISTVGQSIFTNLSEDIREAARDFARSEADLEAIRSDNIDFPGEALYDGVIKTLEARRDSVEFLRRSCAELNSLIRILGDSAATANDVLHLVATETSDGVLAARILADFAMMYFERDTEIHVIEGLQVVDGERFQRVGLRSLIKLLYSLLNNAPVEVFRRVINPTGGFKGVVPYLTIVGMLEKQVEISYIYEKSPELIRLSGLPIVLDYTQLRDHVDVLARLDTTDTLEEDDLRTILHLRDRQITQHPIWPFIEYEDIDDKRYYTLSGLGQIALEHIRDVDVMPVFLSRQASERLTKSSNGSEEQRNFHKILNSIHDSLLRKNNLHVYPNGAGALVYKLGRQAERAFYFDKGDHILVAVLARHKNESEYDIVPQSAKDYGKFERWERNQGNKKP